MQNKNQGSKIFFEVRKLFCLSPVSNYLLWTAVISEHSMLPSQSMLYSVLVLLWRWIFPEIRYLVFPYIFFFPPLSVCGWTFCIILVSVYKCSQLFCCPEALVSSIGLLSCFSPSWLAVSDGLYADSIAVTLVRCQMLSFWNWICSSTRSCINSDIPA